MNTTIKICGLRRELDIDYVNQLQPDMIGFVFAESKRRITPEEAKKLRHRLREEIIAVGVFVNANQEEILSLVAEQTIQIIQLHGQEDTQYLENLRKYTKAPVIKACSIQRKTEKIETKHSLFDFCLFDAVNGGGGNTFDWNNLPQEIEKPFFLAGGLRKENIKKAIQKVAPYGVDVSSGVETAGEKDYHKMKELIQMVRQMAYEENADE